MEGSSDASDDSIQFKVVTPGGSEFHVTVSRTLDTVREIRLQLEQQNELPPATILKLLQDAEILADERPVADLDPSKLLLAVVTRDSRLEVLLQAAGTFQAYAELLSNASEPVDGKVTVGPMPSILDVLEDMGGELYLLGSV